jgi:hypothetical protein
MSDSRTLQHRGMKNWREVRHEAQPIHVALHRHNRRAACIVGFNAMGVHCCLYRIVGICVEG